MSEDDACDTGCRFIERCSMFPLFKNELALAVYKEVFCHGRFKDCERFKLASTGTKPSDHLLPDGEQLPLQWRQ